MKKIIAFALSLMMLVTLLPMESKAYQPASHFVLIEKVTDALPNNSLIKTALERYPDVAIWGANGPDIAFAYYRKMLGGISQIGDSYHRYRVGSYASEQLRLALASKDLRKIAFAAGWITHVTGDMECHGVLVNPEAGVCFAEGADNDLHKAIESSAEPYTWVNIGGHALKDYTASHVSGLFASIGDVPFDLMKQATDRIYDFKLSTSDMKLYAKTYMTGMSTGIGYTYKNYDDAMKFLNQNNRIQTLERTIKDATSWSVDLLTAAEQGNYNGFTDAWNLDIGVTNRPISSFVVKIKTMDKLFAGTDDDVMFGIVTKSGATQEWLLDKPLYDDFERGDLDDYHVYLKDGSIKPSDIKKIYIRKDSRNTASPDWDCEWVQVELNGKPVFKEILKKEFSSKHNYWERNVSFQD